MDIALYQLRTFWEVARAESITQAGRRLGYSQSTVTSHIRALESQAGAPLFQRLPHGVRLTQAGETFHCYVARLFSLVDELSDALTARGETTGRVSVGVASLLVDKEMTRLIWECQYRYPKVELSPLTMHSSRIAEEITAGKLDVGLVLARPGCPEDNPADLRHEDLHPLDLVPVASPGLDAVLKTRRGLDGVRVLQIDSGCPSHQFLRDEMAAAYGVGPEFTSAGSVRGILELMRNGRFAAMLPEDAVSTEVERGDVIVLDELPRQHRVVRLMWSEQSWLPPAVGAVLEIARRWRGAGLTVAA
ncbi:LysR family transcriptional regulator [Streptomyces sp. PR69]|uniref:LysR family transcriptional regulator n=1 Tax=Streptomyces sp. PR69 TaxID=2984950 RepID=UPI002264E79B|nr:LysR family transcriptional regulator [Streptomyces sp. PR69]